MWMWFSDASASRPPEDEPAAAPDADQAVDDAAASEPASPRDTDADPAGEEARAPDAPLDDHAADEDEGAFADEVQHTLAAVLPWVVSIVLHVGVVLIALLVAWTTIAEEEEDPVVVPSLSYTPTPPQVQVQQQQVQRQVQERTLQPIQVQTPTEAIEVSPEGVGELAEIEAPPAAEPFDALSGEDSRFEVRFFVRGNARKVAFLIDASGSLTDSLYHVIKHLETTIEGLSEPQEFTILFFQGDDVIEVPPPGLQRASAANKDAALRWLRSNPVIPSQGTDPINAIRRALRYRPQLLFILSDNLTNAGAGPFEVPQWRLVQEIEQANLGNTKIKAIQFLYEDPLDRLPQREGTMKRIARLFGAGPDGNLNEWYTFIDERDLNIE